MKIFFEAENVVFDALIHEEGVGFQIDNVEGVRLEAGLTIEDGFQKWITENCNSYTKIASNKNRAHYIYEGEESDFLEDQCIPSFGLAGNSVSIEMVVGDYGVFSGDFKGKTPLARYEEEKRNYLAKAEKMYDSTEFEESINPQNTKNKNQIVKELALVLHGASGRRIC